MSIRRTMKGVTHVERGSPERAKAHTVRRDPAGMSMGLPSSIMSLKELNQFLSTFGARYPDMVFRMDEDNICTVFVDEHRITVSTRTIITAFNAGIVRVLSYTPYTRYVMSSKFRGTLDNEADK